MAGMKAEHINPFLMAGVKVLKDMCFVDATIGKPEVRAAKFTSDTLIIIIGITGEMKGQIMLSFLHEIACDIASKMCMMPITQLDELSTSAICELGNMIMGNTATIFSSKGVGIDITPPTLCHGDVEFSIGYAKNMYIPITYEGDKEIGFNLAIKGD